jgi:hypothetical protein
MLQPYERAGNTRARDRGTATFYDTKSTQDKTCSTEYKRTLRLPRTGYFWDCEVGSSSSISDYCLCPRTRVQNSVSAREIWNGKSEPWWHEGPSVPGSVTTYHWKQSHFIFCIKLQTRPFEAKEIYNLIFGYNPIINENFNIIVK